MTARRTPVLPGLVLLAATVLVACGGEDEPAGSQSGRASSSSVATSAGTSAATSAAASAPATTLAPREDESGDAPPFPADTAPDTADAAPGSAVTVTGIRTGHHDGFDRVVFDVAGTGAPGWDVRYVPQAVEQGRGEPIDVAGKAVLQVTLTGVGYPTDTGIEEYDGSAPLPGSGTAVVTEVVWDSTFEGTSVAFVGTTERVPFRVYLLQGPARVVLDVVVP